MIALVEFDWLGPIFTFVRIVSFDKDKCIAIDTVTHTEFRSLRTTMFIGPVLVYQSITISV